MLKGLGPVSKKLQMRKIIVRAIFIENSTVSFENATTQAKIHLTTIWLFLQQAQKRFPQKLQMHQKITGFDHSNRISSEQYGRDELRDDSEYLKQIAFGMTTNLRLPQLVANKSFGFGIQIVCNTYSRCCETPIYYGRLWPVTKRSKSTRFLGKPNETTESYKVCLGTMYFKEFKNFQDT